MPHPDRCPHCHHDSLRRPPRAGALLVALAWAFVAALLFGSALIGPFIMFALPVIFAVGTSVVRCAHEAAFAPTTCARCEKVVLAESPATRRAATATVPRLA